jgi:hypothetical protein
MDFRHFTGARSSSSMILFANSSVGGTELTFPTDAMDALPY